MKISTAAREYLIEIEVRKFTPKTIRSYRNNLNLFLRYCETEAQITDVDEITLATIRQFTSYLSSRGKKGSYINGLLRVAKVFIQYCYDEGYGGFNTRKNFKWCRQDKAVIMAFKPEDVRRMVKSCKGGDYLNIRDAAIITTLFETGIRCWELCCIQKKDIHDDFILINGKNHKQRVVPITPVLRKALLKYDVAAANYFTLKNTDDYYFLSNHGRQLTNSAVEHIIKRHGEGISGIRVSPHTCRHFYAQQHIKMGTDLYTISRLLGHESIDMTAFHVFRLENRIAADGSNAVYLLVDGQEIGTMDNHYVGGTNKNQQVNWADGKDLVFGNIGTSSHPVKDMKLDYLQIWEQGHVHNYESTVTPPTCTNQGYTTHTCDCGDSYVDDYVTENGHSFADVQHVTAPTADALGLDKHTCSVCGVVETFEVEGAWQKYDLADHLQRLPAEFCSGTNLWELLKPEVLMLDHHGNWVDVSGPVYSVTIPMNAGDRVFANSFVEKGIQVSFIGEYGILKTYFSADTKRAYQENGCLIAPEGTIAVNIPVWNVDDADNCLHILNYEHSYDVFTVEPTCTEDGYSKNGCRTCEEGTISDVVKAPGHMVTFLPGQEATCTTDGITEGSFCSVCNQVLMEQEIIPAGHTVEVMDSVIPGVEHTGLTAGLSCAGCGMVFVSQKEIPTVKSLEDYLYGKYVSVLGDSVSTYEGVSNDPDSNSHTVNNVAGYRDGGYYKNDDVLSVDQTWWMQSINNFSMRLLVNHASGSGTLLTKVSNGTLPAYYDEKCANLHDNTGDNAGTLPEIIAVYIGVNDGSRKQIPGSVGEIDFENLIQGNSENGYVYATPTTMAEGYAVMLHKMQVAYPDAEIFLFTIPRTNDPVPAYADTIKDVANYFGVRVVDLYNSVLTQTGYSKYFHDGVHPNAAGMEIVSQIFNAELLDLAMEYHLADGHKFDEGICEICGEAQPGPVITQQPESVEQEIGKEFVVTVKAEGYGLTYQWYYKDVGMEEFAVSDNTASSYAYTMQSDMHNRQVYCVVTDAYGNQVTTEIATITCTNHFVAAVTSTDGSIRKFETLDEALLTAASGDTVVLLKDAEIYCLLVPVDVDFDLNGNVLTAAYVASFGNIVDNSQNNAGHLKVSEEKILIQKSNRQLPVKDQGGYRFVEVLKFNQRLYPETYKFVFQPRFEEAAHPYILQGKDLTGLTVGVKITWQDTQGARSQVFTYNDTLVTQFIQSYKGPGTNSYKSMFTLTLTGAENLKNLQFQIVVKSETGVEILSDPVLYPGT